MLRMRRRLSKILTAVINEVLQSVDRGAGLLDDCFVHLHPWCVYIHDYGMRGLTLLGRNQRSLHGVSTQFTTVSDGSADCCGLQAS